MTTFAPQSISPFKKTQVPPDEHSLQLYHEQQLRNIEKSIGLLVGATKQLQGIYGQTYDWTVIQKFDNGIQFVPQASAPASPVEGTCYWNSTTHKLVCWDGTLWQNAW